MATKGSYTGNPTINDRDKVRFLIGDTDSAEWLLSDDEIGYLLASNSVELSAVLACENIAAKFARLADRTIGALSVSYSQRYTNYKDLANMLRSQLATSLGATGVWAGGISIADKETREEDTDRAIPAFSRAMMRGE